MRSAFPVRVLAAAAVGLGALAAGTAASPAVAAPSLSDPSAQGSLGFCSSSGKQVRSGDLGAAPFAYRAVSSAATPEGYEHGRATLYVFQPRPQVDPGEWSGKQMTASTTFSNSEHPMAAGTKLDPALVDFTSVFKPQVDNLVQVRMYFTGPNQAQHTIPYPAAVVQIKGSTWTQVGGASVDCTSGTARSQEEVALPKARLAAPAGRSTSGAAQQPSSTGGTQTVTGGASAQPGATSGGPAAAEGGSASPVASEKSASDAGSGSSGAVIAVIVVLAVAAAGATVFWIRRRRTA